MDEKEDAIVSTGNVSELIELPPMPEVIGELEALARDGLSGGWAGDEILGPSVRPDGSIIMENKRHVLRRPDYRLVHQDCQGFRKISERSFVMKNVICYINQFFAGIGGEDKADYEPEIRDGVMGPTAAINQMLAEIDAPGYHHPFICGDNFIEHTQDEAIERILTALEGREFDLFLAGPAFQAGRYRSCLR